MINGFIIESLTGIGSSMVMTEKLINYPNASAIKKKKKVFYRIQCGVFVTIYTEVADKIILSHICC